MFKNNLEKLIWSGSRNETDTFKVQLHRTTVMGPRHTVCLSFYADA